MPGLKEKIIKKKKSKKKLDKPPLYKVVMLNDNYTPMDFVVYVLMSVFSKPKEEAINLMLKIHNTGAGICGVYPYDIAITKAEMVHVLARGEGYPLKCIVEPE